MNTLASENKPLAQHVVCSHDALTVELLDGRSVSVPLSWFPLLAAATPAERDNWQLLGDGEGIHWPDLDEDLSVVGLLEGVH